MRRIGVWARSSRQQIKAAIWVRTEVFCIRNSKAAAPNNFIQPGHMQSKLK